MTFLFSEIVCKLGVFSPKITILSSLSTDIFSFFVFDKFSQREGRKKDLPTPSPCASGQ